MKAMWCPFCSKVYSIQDAKDCKNKCPLCHEDVTEQIKTLEGFNDEDNQDSL
uniref:Uncharacterized protein n=1 Tax=viral metagenome TaxID=1070528 RepID=A0A6M3LLE6_9ZZZZ